MVLTSAFVSIYTGMGTSLIDLPSASLVIVSLLFSFFTSKSGKIFGTYIKTSFKKEHSYTPTELAALSAAAKNTIKFILAAGGFFSCAGLVAVLCHLGALDKLGPALAVSLITLTYSIAVSCFVFFPVQAWAENKVNILKDNAKEAVNVL
jgi:flagellar motor component MotA